MANKDTLFDKAKKVVQKYPEGYAGTLQKHLDIGYNRAAKLLNDLEREGVITKNHGTGDYKLKRLGLIKRVLAWLGGD